MQLKTTKIEVVELMMEEMNVIKKRYENYQSVVEVLSEQIEMLRKEISDDAKLRTQNDQVFLNQLNELEHLLNKFISS